MNVEPSTVSHGCVESVALVAFFLFLSLLAWFRFREERRDAAERERRGRAFDDLLVRLGRDFVAALNKWKGGAS